MASSCFPRRARRIIVVNTRRFRLTQWWVALTLSAATGRPVRFVGRSDLAPFGALARRLGGLLERPDEVAGALRDGQLLVVGLSGTLDPRRIGRCDPHVLAPAVGRKVPVFPAAVALSAISPVGAHRDRPGDPAAAAARPARRRRDRRQRSRRRSATLLEAVGRSA